MKFEKFVKKELGKIDDANFLRECIEAGKKSSSAAWNRQFEESKQRIQQQHTLKQINRLEADNLSSSNGSKWGNSPIVGLD